LGYVLAAVLLAALLVPGALASRPVQAGARPSDTNEWALSMELARKAAARKKPAQVPMTMMRRR
jgi:hypothetical protein